MTLTYADGYALIPKRCDCCNRLFIFEFYWKTHKRWIDNPTGPGIGVYDVECKNCHMKRVPRTKYIRTSPEESKEFFKDSRDMTDEELVDILKEKE